MRENRTSGSMRRGERRVMGHSANGHRPERAETVGRRRPCTRPRSPFTLPRYALPAFHRAVGRSRGPTDLLGRGPDFIHRFGGGGHHGAFVRVIFVRVIHRVRHVEPPSLSGGVRRACVVGTMQAGVVAVVARWRPAWRRLADLKRSAVVADRDRANVGTNRDRGASRWRSGTWAYHNAAIPAGGYLSGADP